jgi:hypothetical protein
MRRGAKKSPLPRVRLDAECPANATRSRARARSVAFLITPQ